MQPDVVVMDLRMADLSGAEAMQMIVERCSSVRVLALSVSAQREDVTGAVRAGATGYLLKDARIDEVAAAVRAAADGAAWLSAAAADLVLGMLRESPRTDEPSVEELSLRELDVLRLLARGMENAQIAATLNISPRTTKNHVSNILAKLGLPNRLMAAIYAVRRGLA
jgi:DNA-binding NarL/FixJ family response regulator